MGNMKRNKENNEKNRTRVKVQFTGKQREKEDQSEDLDRLEGRNSVMAAIRANRRVRKKDQ